MDLNSQGYAIREASGLLTQPDVAQTAPAPSLVPESIPFETRVTRKLRPLPATRSNGVDIPPSTNPLVIDAPADPNATVDIDDDVIIVNHVVPRQVNDTTFLASGSPSLPPSTHMSMPDPGLTTGRVLRPRVVTRQATYSGSDDDNHIPVQVRRGRPPGTLNPRTAKALNTKIEALEQNVEALWKKLEEQSQSVSSPGESEASAIAMLQAENGKLSEKIEKLKRKNRKLKKAVAELPEHLRGPY